MWRREMAWRRLDEHGEERCAFLCSEDNCIVEGIGAIAINGAGLIYEYRIEHGADWSPRRAEILARLGSDEFRVVLERRDNDQWHVDGVHVEQFDGCKDVDLSFSASTNTTTIKRLGLEVGQEVSSRAVYVTEPELKLEVLEQSYRRTSPDTYEYRSGDYRVIITVDAEDVVSTYAGRFEPALEPAGLPTEV